MIERSQPERILREHDPARRGVDDDRRELSEQGLGEILSVTNVAVGDDRRGWTPAFPGIADDKADEPRAKRSIAPLAGGAVRPEIREVDLEREGAFRYGGSLRRRFARSRRTVPVTTRRPRADGLRSRPRRARKMESA